MEKVLTSSEKQYKSCLTNFLAKGGTLPCKARQLSLFVSEYGDIKREDRLKASSLNVYLSAVRRWHIQNQLVSYFGDDRLVREEIERLKVLERQCYIEKDKSRFMQPEEAIRLYAHLAKLNPTLRNCRDRAMIALALRTGYRQGMISDLRYDWFNNLHNNEARITIDRPGFKTHPDIHSKLDPVTSEYCAVTWINQYLEMAEIRSGLVFHPITASGELVRDAGKISNKGVNTIFIRHCKGAGIDTHKLSAHSLRSTFAVLSIAGGSDATAVAAQGGWTSVDTIYKNYVQAALALRTKADTTGLSYLGLGESKHIDAHLHHRLI